MNLNPLLPLPEQRLFAVTVENVTVEFLAEQTGAETEQITSITRHDHAYIELFACTSGSVVIDTENGETLLGAGDVAIIPAHFRHIPSGIQTGYPLCPADQNRRCKKLIRSERRRTICLLPRNPLQIPA